MSSYGDLVNRGGWAHEHSVWRKVKMHQDQEKVDPSVTDARNRYPGRSTNGIPATVEALLVAGFCGCVLNGKPCMYANRIKPAVDTVGSALECLRKAEPVSVERSLLCNSQRSKMSMAA